MKKGRSRLSAETVQSASLALQGVHHVHGSDCLSFGVLSVGNSITDHVLQEHFENTTGLLVDQAGDTLHTTTPSQPTDSWFGDPLNVVTKDLSVALSTSFSQTLASFSTSRHADLLQKLKKISVNLATSCHLLSQNLALFSLPDLIVIPRVRMRIIKIPKYVHVRK